MKVVGAIRCASCGWSTLVGTVADGPIGAVVREPEALARVVAAHLDGCPERFKGHPAFGFEARWMAYPDVRGVEILEIAWSDSGWGLPFNLAAGREP